MWWTCRCRVEQLGAASAGCLRASSMCWSEELLYGVSPRALERGSVLQSTALTLALTRRWTDAILIESWPLHLFRFKTKLDLSSPSNTTCIFYIAWDGYVQGLLYFTTLLWMLLLSSLYSLCLHVLATCAVSQQWVCRVRRRARRASVDTRRTSIVSVVTRLTRGARRIRSSPLSL